MSEETVTPQKRRGRVPDILPMDDAPHDGKPIWLHDENQMRTEAIWHNTRRYSSVSRVWEVTGFWVKRNSGGIRIEFEPIGWTHIKGWNEA